MMKLLVQIPRFFNQIRYTSSLIGKEKDVTFKTCREFYASKAKRFLYRNGSCLGIDVHMKYLDTDPEKKNKAPTILAIHGSPGSNRDFMDLIIKLQQRGYRVIAPNLPDMKLTDSTVTFYHSTEEKSELLCDFMKAIDIPSVDLAIVHSAGVFPTMKVWHDRTMDIKSLLLINPSGHRTIKAMKPEWLINNLLRLNLIPPGRWLYSRYGHLIAQAAKVKVDASKEASDNAVLACLTVYMAGITRLARYLQVLGERKTPTSFFYSDRDKLIDHDIFLEMLQFMGATDENINIASQNEILRAAGKDLDWLRVYNLKNAGHFAYKQNIQLLENEVCRLVPIHTQRKPQVHEREDSTKWDQADDDLYGSSGNRRAYALSMSAPRIDY